MLLFDVHLSRFVDAPTVRAVLADFFSLPLDEVEPGTLELEARTWREKVHWEYSRNLGDFAVTVSGATQPLTVPEPTEEDLALGMATRLDMSVYFPPLEEVPPSVWRVATPQGATAYVRIEEPCDDENPIVVTETEIPVAEVPDVHVTEFSDVVKRVPGSRGRTRCPRGPAGSGTNPGCR